MMGKGTDDSSMTYDSAVLSATAPDDAWVQVCADSVYIPTAADIGCVLKIECRAVLNSNPAGELLAGPVVIVTTPVLSAPQPPPARPLRAVVHGGWAPGTTTAGRFRVLNYNMLAEVYATRHVRPAS